ncbi:transposase [Planctomyces sp. SH-PL62]|uniref:transposase n=1 Tax=Planctomyces sp. SH-PL62 TaxID=1636152 RepID=UPI00078EE275|nr:transposase [Planctomyces sp. SH-PL62]AMV41024.1 hypothetical protein VT85_26550 [Planctomyces sp. SH-PL62]
MRGRESADDRLDGRPRPSARRRGAARKGGAEPQALGRSRGGFTTDAVRDVVLDALRVIPNRKEPWPWHDEMRETYKQRNRVERAFAEAKQFRRFATRYEQFRRFATRYER